MVINKKRQPCTGIIQNVITFRKKKLKQDLGHTHINTHIHTPTWTVYTCYLRGMCSNVNMLTAWTKGEVNTARVKHRLNSYIWAKQMCPWASHSRPDCGMARLASVVFLLCPSRPPEHPPPSGSQRAVCLLPARPLGHRNTGTSLPISVPAATRRPAEQSLGWCFSRTTGNAWPP